MSEWDFNEQAAYGEELNREMSDHELMCQHYGISDWNFLSLSEKANYLWNWNKFDRKTYARAK